jgi:CRP-like cAMP-binding protein
MAPFSPIDAELKHIPLFAGLSNRQLALASLLATQLHLPAGRILAREGTTGAEFFIVLDGQVEVVQGRELIATRGPGSPLGEIALLGARPRTATLIAQTPLRVRVSSQHEFAYLLTDIPNIEQRLHATMTERLAA